MNIAQVAQSFKKPTKREALEIVLGLYENNPNNELAKLYKFFEPSVPKNPKTVEGWILKACADKKDIDYLQYVYSDGETLVATNGYRLHLCRNVKWLEGYYDKAFLPINLSYTYPKFENIISPEREARQVFKVSDIDRTSFLVLLKKKELYHYKIGDLKIDKKYFDDAISFISGDSEVFVFDSKIQIHDGNQLAIISSMR